MIKVPPSDPEYNAKIEGHPKYKLACTLSNIITAAGAGAFIIPIAIQFVLMVKSFAPWLLPTIAFLIIALMPITISLVAFFRGLMWYNIRSTVSNPSPILGLFFAGIGLVAGGAMFSFTDYGNIFIAAALLALVLWVAMLLTTSEFKAYTKLDMGNILALLFVCLVFSYGAYTTSNCLFDTSEPQIFKTIVTNKETYENKDHEESFYVHYTPVAGIDRDEMEVDEYFYKSVNTNDTIQFKLKAGKWGSAWYYLDTD